MGNLHGVSGPARPSLMRCALTSAALSLLFLIIYGSCNWITTQRTDVGTWFYSWERSIPFVPTMILPYMSIDLFFVAAPFLCSNRRELTILARRIVLAIVIAGICFLLLPLRFAFDRPHAVGWLGAIFDWFRTMDHPHNLFPSLHIALQLILVDLYARHTRGLLRAVVVVWFGLIGISTVLTYQHHVVDVLGGVVLATFCFYLVRATALRLPVVRNFRIATYYVVGTLTCLAAAIWTWPFGGILLWPASALAIMTAAYLGIGPGVFRKSKGNIPISARLVLGPVLLGQFLSLAYYRRKCPAWDEVVPGLWIGRQLTDVEATQAVHQDVTAVLDLTAEFSEASPFLARTYLHLPILDLTAPTLSQLQQAAAFIAEQAATGVVYVHCKIGYSRSAAVVGAFLLDSGKVDTAEAAVALLGRVRPQIVIRPEAWAALRSYERELGAPLVGLEPTTDTN